jgi:hypothetical protein
MEKQDIQTLEEKARESLELKLERRDLVEKNMLNEIRRGGNPSSRDFNGIFSITAEINSLRELLGEPLDDEVLSDKKLL